MIRNRSWRFLVAAIALVLGTVGTARGEAIRSIDEFLVNDGELPFAQARNRIAMFTFEDPDDTRLGDSIAFLASKRVLFDADVGSLAIILFEQGLTPDDSGLGYFDKVDKLTTERDFIAAMWGHIARDGDDVVVDTFVQLYSPRFEQGFKIAGLDDELRAHLSPSRIWVQSLKIPLSRAESIHDSAEAVRRLRESPDAEASSVPGGYLKQGTTYYLNERAGSWRELVISENEVRGWTSVDAHCGRDTGCAEVIAGAGFLNEMLRFANDRHSDDGKSGGLTASAEAIRAQINLLALLHSASREVNRLEEVVKLATHWTAKADASGKATFANLRAVALLQILERTGAFNPGTVQPVTSQLARMALEDPGNLDLLHNLSILFRFLGDDRKSNLARKLYDEQIVRSGRAP